MKIKRKKKRAPRKRSWNLTYIVPSAFTMMNLYFGYNAINYAIKGKFSSAGLFIILAAVMDFLDGRIARAIKANSAFGIQLDSLADLISFGVAPSVLFFLWTLKDVHKIGLFVSFLFLAAGALRLSRFNVMQMEGGSSKRFFEGLPIPSAAMVLVATVLLFKTPPVHSYFSVLMCASVFVLSFLMVSKIKYRSFKDINIRTKRSYLVLFFFAIAFSIFALWPYKMIAFASYTYALSGPALELKNVLKGKTARLEENEQRV